MNSETIYVGLLDDGTDVWRPVQAEPLPGGRYKLLGPMPENECWAFQPGSVVVVQLKLLSGGYALVAVCDG